MNWKVLLPLSGFGIAMGCLALFGLTKGVEPILWLLIYILSALVIAKRAGPKYFLHGFLLGVLNGIWVTLIHAYFFDTYILHNPEMLEQYQKIPQSINPRVMMFIIGPLIGAVTGVVAGLLAILAARIFRRNPNPSGTAAAQQDNQTGEHDDDRA